MSAPATPRCCDHFADLPDPRIDRTRRHDLLDIVTIAICAVICGADSWADVERFGQAKLPWFRAFLALPGGIPSHDTFGRVFAALDPLAFETAFLGWVGALVTATDGTVVAIDGKTTRRSHGRTHDRGPLHLVSAWAAANHVVLGQVATDEHSNEITAIPTLLDALALEGTIVTIDAMGCQTAIADQIVAGDGDDVLALKPGLFMSDNGAPPERERVGTIPIPERCPACLSLPQMSYRFPLLAPCRSMSIFSAVA